MVVTYCKTSDVSRVLGALQRGKRLDFTVADSVPTKQEVEHFIEEAESDLEDKTNNSWKPKRVDQLEYADYYGHEIHAHYWKNYYAWKLDHRPVVDMVQGTDTAEIYDGNDWIDVLALTKGVAFMDGDYWIDEERGVFYLFTNFPAPGRKVARFDYQWGRTVVPNSLRLVTAQHVSIRLVMSYGHDLIEGDLGLSAREQIEMWQKQIDDFIAVHSQKTFKAFVA